MKRFANRLRSLIRGISSINSKQYRLKYKGAIRHLFLFEVRTYEPAFGLASAGNAFEVRMQKYFNFLIRYSFVLHS